MKISSESITKTCPEAEVFESVLQLDNKNILELGCGTARITRLIATTGKGRTITATEVDKIQHKKNKLIDDLPNVRFKLAGAESIPADDNSFDVVFMFKSLHHVPVDQMDQVFQEINRVVKPQGLVYISEPIFKGDFNEIIRLFHNEETVRQYAFNAIKTAIDKQLFSLHKELFFNSPSTYDSFQVFEQRIINVTHTEHSLSDELYNKVKEKFNFYHQKNGGNFLSPIRVDILKK